MENGQDKKIKSTATPEEELFEELDTMYQRVADIEKEEEEALFSTYGTQPAPEKPLREKIGRNERRPYRPMILGAIAVLFAFILASRE